MCRMTGTCEESRTRGNASGRFGGRGQENPRPRGSRTSRPRPHTCPSSSSSAATTIWHRRAAASAARPVQPGEPPPRRTLGSEPTRSQHGAPAETETGSVVRRHRRWSYSGWEISPPPSEIAERAARPEAGRNGKGDAMGKALFGSTPSVSSIRPWRRSRPSDGRVPPAASPTVIAGR